jgi:hypothetical protein
MKKCLSIFSTILFALLASGSTFAQSGDGRDRTVLVYNGTNTTIDSFYASTTNRNSWQEDLLQNMVLLSGETVEMNLDDGSGRCMYDVKVVFSLNKGAYTRNSINVCSVYKIRIRAGGIFLD